MTPVKNELYYHYCSVDTFVKIMETSTIRLSNPYKMNDTQEYKWLLNILPEVMNEYINQIDNDEIREKYRYFYIEVCDQIFENFYKGMEDEHPYIACFSKEGDVLSQWRSYADDSRGVSIGFDLNKLIENSNLKLKEVSYSVDEQKSLLIDILKKNGLDDPDTIQFKRMKHMAEAAMILLENILSESIGCKNPAFREEREVRLIYSYDPYRNGDDWNKKVTISDLQFRNDREKIISYFTVNFSKLKEEIIKSIYIGSNSKLNDGDLKKFLIKCGYNEYRLIVHSSSSTYR
ncbi:DUF2971 domain-containing protein [Paenibacillus sp. FSL P2-0536]|uniref:DUF2971 domain-containing protein n=1 Tax=Paenibacillus TaxID=44249 RepID=UPI0004F5BB3F|nr:DUF2971 domain-containing protein [Paenibacillus odorifer]AIQ75891.1 hypothetical protein PODO_23010 [Paenibacillus odorifer]